ncbi:hypothetical protein [Pseudarthrobacter sp. AB1]|uniref:hypothetical protein n=1 Tax=Pseudarthrobacter sp. AB1 TaxID=2138309 RepID=UPI001D03F722|nr:hypothetical protein [Pseudarthrobacter sp. AB1]
MAGHPLGALVLKGLDLVLRSAVKLLARDILIDFRRTLAVRAVGAAKITRVGYTDRPVFGTFPAKLTGAGVSTVEAAWGTVLAVAERLAVVAARESTTFAVAITAGTITEGLVVAIAVRLAIPATEGTPLTVTLTTGTITKGLVVAIAVRLTLTTTTERLTVVAARQSTTFAVTLATGTITKGLVVAVAIRLTLTTTTERLTLTTTTERLTLTTTTERLTLTTTEGTPLTVTLTTGTITKGLVVAVAVRLTLTTTTERLTLTTTEGTPLTVTLTTGTITERLVVAITVRLTVPATTERLTLTGTRRTLRSLGVTVFPGTESTRIAAGIVVAAERTAVLTAAVAAVVLSHGDSSCYEPTTGAIAAARSVFRYPTQPEIKRFEVRTSQSILGESPPTDDMDPSTGHRRGNVHTPSGRPHSFCGVPGTGLWCWLGVFCGLGG